MCTACECVMAGYAIYNLLAENPERFNLPHIRGCCVSRTKLAVNMHKTAVLFACSAIVRTMLSKLTSLSWTAVKLTLLLKEVLQS